MISNEHHSCPLCKKPVNEDNIGIAKKYECMYELAEDFVKEKEKKEEVDLPPFSDIHDSTKTE